MGLVGQGEATGDKSQAWTGNKSQTGLGATGNTLDKGWGAVRPLHAQGFAALRRDESPVPIPRVAAASPGAGGLVPALLFGEHVLVLACAHLCACLLLPAAHSQPGCNSEGPDGIAQGWGRCGGLCPRRAGTCQWGQRLW